MPLWEKIVLAQAQGRADAHEQARLKTGAEPDLKPAPKTRIVRRNNITINRSEKVIDEEVPGHVDEAMVKSTSNFSIELLIDGSPVFHESMSDLISMSGTIESISVISSGGYYKFNITNLTYNTLFLRVFLEGSGNFDIFRKLRRDPDAN